MFDTRYWMYMEDLDLCYRFAAAGWTTWFEPSVTVTHVKAGTSGEHRSPRLNRAFHYGMFRFYRDHYAAAKQPAAQRRGLRRDRRQARGGDVAQRARRAAPALSPALARSRARRLGLSPFARQRRPDPLDRGRVRAEQRREPARWVGIGDVRARELDLQRRSSAFGSSVSSSANSSALASTWRESWLPGMLRTNDGEGDREQVDRDRRRARRVDALAAGHRERAARARTAARAGRRSRRR